MRKFDREDLSDLLNLLSVSLGLAMLLWISIPILFNVSIAMDDAFVIGLFLLLAIRLLRRHARARSAAWRRREERS